MAKSINEPSGGGGPPPAGHNQVDQDTFLSFVRQITAEQAKVEAAKSGLKSVRKQAKASGIELGHLDAVVRMSEWSIEEVREHYALSTRYAIWLGLPLGEQADLFADENAAPAKPTDKAAEWDAKGFMAATTGKGVFGDGPPAECPPEHHQDWLHGVERGTARNAPKKLEPVH